MANNAVATRFFKESWHISGIPFTRRRSQRSQFTPVFSNPYGKRAARPSLSNSASSWKVLTELTIQKVFSQSSNNGQSLLPLKDIRKALEEKDREYIWWPVSTRESLASLTPDVNWLRLWDDAGDYGLPRAKALMANLRNLTTLTFENYSCHFCGQKLDSMPYRGG